MRQISRSITEDDRLLVAQRGVVAVWQLLADGWSEAAVRHAVADWREVHDGVYLTGHAPPTEWQLWKAATITAPMTGLADWSAASFLGMREGPDRMPTMVARPGSGGRAFYRPREGRIGSLKVRRSKTVTEDLVVVDDIRSVSVPRTLLDLMPHMGDRRADRMVRDVLRQELSTRPEILALTARLAGARRVARLRALVNQYASIDMKNGRSDAEVLAKYILMAAGFAPPALNAIVAGEEGDLVFLDDGHIVELDGPQYHVISEEDARKQAIWEDAGWTVSRLPTDDVYERPHRLFAAAVPPPRLTPFPSTIGVILRPA